MALTKGHTFTSGEIVTPTKLNNLVDDATIDANSIDSDHYVDGSIDLAHLSVDSVDASKIVDGTITAAKLDSGVAGASAIDDLTDVDTTTAAPTDNQALVWVNAASKWEPGTMPSAGALTKYNSGWVTEDNSASPVTVANAATLTFTHGLGTADLVVHAYVSPNADGSNSIALPSVDEEASGVNQLGSSVQSISTTSITLQLGSLGYLYMNSSGQTAVTTTNGHDAASDGAVPFASKYIKLIAIG